MPAPALSVFLDVPEPRVARDRLIVSMEGSTSDRTKGSNIWVDPVTSSVFLLPLPLADDWPNNTNIEYAVLRKADYTFITPAKWAEFQRRDTKDWWVKSLGVQNEVVTTNATYSANQPFFISGVFPTGVEGHAVILECGWGDPTTGLKVKMRASGDCEIWKGGVQVGTADLEGNSLLTSANRQGRSQAIAGTQVDVMLIPCRRRELLVVVNRGAGFSHTFTDLSAASSSNTITPSGHFWWKVPKGEACIQACPLHFRTTGTVYGQVVKTRYAPVSGQTFNTFDAWDKVGNGTTTVACSLVNADLSAYTPNGVINQVRVKAVLGGDGSNSPGLYAVDMNSPRTVTSTADASFDLTPYIHSMTLTVPEHGPATIDLETRGAAKLIAAGLAKAGRIGNRPIAAFMGTTCIFRGTVSRPEQEWGGGQATEELDRLTWKATDREGSFRRYQFADTFAYDGLTYTQSQQDLAALPGFDPSEIEVSADTFVLPLTPGVSLGDWQLMPERGDTVAKWQDKLRQGFAATWDGFWGPTAGGYKWRHRNPALLSLTPLTSMFTNSGDALAIGVPSDRVADLTIRAWHEMPEDIEANQVIVLGWDPRTRQILPGQYDDAASQAPGTAPGSKPDNWTGELWRYQWIDNSLSTQAAVDRAVTAISGRITGGRDLVQMGAGMVFVNNATGLPLWKSDVFRAYKKRPTALSPFPCLGDFRVLALTIRFIAENGTYAKVREGSYKLLKVGAGADAAPVGGG